MKITGTGIAGEERRGVIGSLALGSLLQVPRFKINQSHLLFFA